MGGRAQQGLLPFQEEAKAKDCFVEDGNQCHDEHGGGQTLQLRNSTQTLSWAQSHPNRCPSSKSQAPHIHVPQSAARSWRSRREGHCRRTCSDDQREQRLEDARIPLANWSARSETNCCWCCLKKTSVFGRGCHNGKRGCERIGRKIGGQMAGQLRRMRWAFDGALSGRTHFANFRQKSF